MEIAQIAICISDNDFNSTMVGILENFHSAYDRDILADECRQEAFTKDQIVEIIRDLVKPSYKLNQSWHGFRTEEDVEHTLEYIFSRLNKDHIYINEEVDAFLEICKGDHSAPWNNCELLILDLRLAEQNQECIRII